MAYPDTSASHLAYPALIHSAFKTKTKTKKQPHLFILVTYNDSPRRNSWIKCLSELAVTLLLHYVHSVNLETDICWEAAKRESTVIVFLKCSSKSWLWKKCALEFTQKTNPKLCLSLKKSSMFKYIWAMQNEYSRWYSHACVCTHMIINNYLIIIKQEVMNLGVMGTRKELEGRRKKEKEIMRK